MLRFYGYADEAGENTANHYKFDAEFIKTLKPKRNGFRQHNKEAIKEVIAISKDKSLIKTHKNYDSAALTMPPIKTLTDPCVEEARIRMGLKKKWFC
jgi:hypothetical protein